MSSRCSVIIQDDIVIKYYFSRASFEAESEIYSRLKGKGYIPKIIEIDEEFPAIIIEKIKAPTLSEYVLKNKEIPSNLALELKNILLDMADEGIVDNPDFYKFSEHVFVEENDKIKVIDFDVDLVFPKDNSNFNEVVQTRKKAIEEEYAFLNGDEKSWERFQQNLFMAGYNKDIVQYFYNNMSK